MMKTKEELAKEAAIMSPFTDGAMSIQELEHFEYGFIVGWDAAMKRVQELQDNNKLMEELRNECLQRK